MSAATQEIGLFMKCPNCGNELRDGARFCAECGARLSATTPAAAAPVFDATQAMPAAAATASPAQETARQEMSGDPDEELRRARRAYCDARRAAGKSNVPRVVGGIVLALALLGGGAGAAWYALRGAPSADGGSAAELEQQVADLQAQLDEAQAQVEEAQAQLEEARAQADDAQTGPQADEGLDTTTDDVGTSAVPAGAREALVGTWTGEMTSVEPLGWNRKRCYGAKGHPISIDIVELEATGQMKLNVTVLYHGHEPGSDNDAETTDGDRYETFQNVTSTYNVEEGYSFRLDYGEGNYAEVTVTPGTKNVETSRYTVAVTSVFDHVDVVTDSYTIEKA